MSARPDAAREYARRGWAVLPIPYRSKNPGFEGWQTFRATERHFGGVGNIGVRLGADSGGLVDIDLDCAEALELADIYLPVTRAVFGRASKPRSHRLYIADGAVFEKFSDRDDNGKCMLELRSDTAAGGRVQTVFPPSIHKDTGEAIEWASDGDPRRIDAALLRRAVAWLAVGCLVARHVDPADGVVDPHRPTTDMAGRILECYPGMAHTVCAWLGIDDPLADLMRRHVPVDIELAALVALIPNDVDREGWVRIGLAIYAAAAGSDEGKAAWLAFSRRSPRYNRDGRKGERADASALRVWASFKKSPPRDIGPASLVWLAARAA